MKRCAKCETSKAPDEFFKNKSRRDGLAAWCKPCSRRSPSQVYDPNSLKHCAACDRDLPRSEFYSHVARGDGKQARCKPCMIRQSQEWRAANPETSRALQRSRRLMRDYGITDEEYTTLLEQQGGMCAGCGTRPSGNRLAVDHDHATGAVRGLLCVRCNRAIGFVRDDPEVLRRLADYLDVPAGADVRPERFPAAGDEAGTHRSAA